MAYEKLTIEALEEVIGEFFKQKEMKTNMKSENLSETGHSTANAGNVAASTGISSGTTTIRTGTLAGIYHQINGEIKRPSNVTYKTVIFGDKGDDASTAKHEINHDNPPAPKGNFFTPRRRQRKAVVKKVEKGKLAGQYRFKLYGRNGECVGSSYPETYTQKHSCIETLISNFDNYLIVDKTGE